MKFKRRQVGFALPPPEIQQLYSRKAPAALNTREKPPTLCSVGMNGKLLTSHLCLCFGEADQSYDLLCWELKRNRKGWRERSASLHWHRGAVLWDLFDNPSPEMHTSQVLLRFLMLLRWSLLTSGKEGWLASCFALYQLLDTLSDLSAWWLRKS